MPEVLMSNLLPSSFFGKKKVAVKPEPSNRSVINKNDNLPQNNDYKNEKKYTKSLRTIDTNGKSSISNMLYLI